jgi:hypothetical protein
MGIDFLPFACHSNGMATPGQLVRTIAEALGIPVSTVTQFDRQLAEAGLRTVGGRGSSAAKVTALDAANLLIALLGPPLYGPAIKAAQSSCNLFGSLPITSTWRDTSSFKKVGLPSLAKLPADHTFRAALAALIEGASTGEFYFLPGSERANADESFYVTVQYMHPRARVTHPSAEISCVSPRSTASEPRDRTRLVYHHEKVLKSGDQSKRDLGQSRVVSFRTLRVLGNLIANKES